MSEFDYGRKRPDGQFERHPFISDGEFVRPVRYSYCHVGIRPKYPTRELTEEENRRYFGFDYVLYEIYPESEAPITGKFWTKKQLNSGCNSVTSMPTRLAETYARNPSFYGRTFCCGCGDYYPVGERGEFVWCNSDGSHGPRVGT